MKKIVSAAGIILAAVIAASLFACSKPGNNNKPGDATPSGFSQKTPAPDETDGSPENTASSGETAKPGTTGDPQTTGQPSGSDTGHGDDTAQPGTTPEGTENVDQANTTAPAPTPTPTPEDVGDDVDGTATPAHTATATPGPTATPTPEPDPTTAPDDMPEFTVPYVGKAGKTYDAFKGLKSDEELWKIDTVIASLTTGDTPVIEKIRKIHDWMVTNIAYDTRLRARHASDALNSGLGICQAYAELFDVFMAEIGVESFTVPGTAGGEAHAWNAVNIGGEWYFVDVTWDDPLVNGHSNYPDARNLRYTYLLVSYETVRQDHRADDEQDLLKPFGENDSFRAALVEKKKSEIEAELRRAASSGEGGLAFVIASEDERDTVSAEMVEALKAAARAGEKDFSATVFCVKGVPDVKAFVSEMSSLLAHEGVEAYHAGVKTGAKTVGSEFYTSVEFTVTAS